MKSHQKYFSCLDGDGNALAWNSDFCSHSAQRAVASFHQLAESEANMTSVHGFLVVEGSGSEVERSLALALQIASRAAAEQGADLEGDAAQREADEREFVARCELAPRELLRKLWLDAARRVRKYLLASAWPTHAPARALLHGRIALLQRLAMYDDPVLHDRDSQENAEVRQLYSFVAIFYCSYYILLFAHQHLSCTRTQP